ncbi:MAG: hypothetical protein HY017_09665 [Betaproteobacteria bacterium]|nr:hypothetical protein [Betaproteobacteria bacterium]
MAMAGYVLDAPSGTDYYLGLMAEANAISAIVDAVQEYLASWSNERIGRVQKVDAGWAPFDTSQRPLRVNGAMHARCIRDAIHCHCMALNEAGLALTPELVELDEFFFVASEMIESFGATAMHLRTPAIRPPAIASQRGLFVNC